MPNTDSMLLPAAGSPADTAPTAVRSVERRSLTEQAADVIRDMILRDELTPGMRIPEQVLSDRLAVSRTPLREALKMLAVEGLVELLPNRGAVVANPGPEEVRDMIHVMASLEALAGKLACERATETEIAELKALHFEMLAAYSRKDRLRYFKLNQQIHLGIMRLARNPILAKTHSNLNARAYRVLYLSHSRSKRWHIAIEDHAKMIRLLERRDAGALSELLRRHREVAWDEVERFLDGDQ